MDEIQSQIDEIVTRLDENDSSQQELSDSIESSIQDLQSNLDEQGTNIDDLKETSGQLSFPLSQDTIDLIKEQFPSGFITLVGGTATLKDGRISTNSNIFLTVAVAGGTQGFLKYTASAGQAIISSTSGTDTSTISYLILN